MQPALTAAVDILPFVAPQPSPMLTLVARVPVGSGHATAITRTWTERDMGRCSLCRTCTAQGTVCQVIVGTFISDSDAEMFSDRGYRLHDEAKGVHVTAGKT